VELTGRAHDQLVDADAFGKADHEGDRIGEGFGRSRDSAAELPDYSGPYRADLRLTDFSKEALATRLLPWSERYLQLCVDGWAAEVARRYGAKAMAEIEWAA
jgi:hypothetical protein